MKHLPRIRWETGGHNDGQNHRQWCLENIAGSNLKTSKHGLICSFQCCFPLYSVPCLAFPCPMMLLHFLAENSPHFTFFICQLRWAQSSHLTPHRNSPLGTPSKKKIAYFQTMSQLDLPPLPSPLIETICNWDIFVKIYPSLPLLQLGLRHLLNMFFQSWF